MFEDYDACEMALQAGGLFGFLAMFCLSGVSSRLPSSAKMLRHQLPAFVPLGQVALTNDLWSYGHGSKEQAINTQTNLNWVIEKV